jgi:hypothetical protein
VNNVTARSFHLLRKNPLFLWPDSEVNLVVPTLRTILGPAGNLTPEVQVVDCRHSYKFRGLAIGFAEYTLYLP